LSFERKGYENRAFSDYFYLPGHISENSSFEDQYNQGLTTFLRDSTRVYKEPEDYGGRYGMVSEIII
jgi:hypothetical protein